MKFTISVTDNFSAAHSLRGYRGKCENLHGHNFKVRVTFGAAKLDKIGMVVDFHQVKEILRSVLRQLDHLHLNELTFFKKNNPTSENIAFFIYGQIEKKIKHRFCKLLAVTVWETEGNEATYQQ
jgi:6-pyruvoyltetrahydropterin/6-carboxytetrahydropterin synthase